MLEIKRVLEVRVGVLVPEPTLFNVVRLRLTIFSVVIRGLATGAIEPSAARDVLLNETAVGLCLSIILGMAGWIRAAAFATPFLETIAITGITLYDCFDISHIGSNATTWNEMGRH